MIRKDSSLLKFSSAEPAHNGHAPRHGRMGESLARWRHQQPSFADRADGMPALLTIGNAVFPEYQCWIGCCRFQPSLSSYFALRIPTFLDRRDSLPEFIWRCSRQVVNWRIVRDPAAICAHPRDADWNEHVDKVNAAPFTREL